MSRKERKSISLISFSNIGRHYVEKGKKVYKGYRVRNRRLVVHSKLEQVANSISLIEFKISEKPVFSNVVSAKPYKPYRDFLR